MKIFKYIVSIIFSLLVFSYLNSNTANATTIKTFGEWNKTPVRHFKNIDIGFNTSSDDINIFVKTSKKKNIKFHLAAGTNIYQLSLNNLLNISFKDKARQDLNLKVIETSSNGKRDFTLDDVGVYRKVKVSKHKNNYILRLSIPIKKLNTDLDRSTIMNLDVDAGNEENHKVTTVGLSTGSLFAIIVSVFSFIYFGIYISKKKLGNNQ